MKSLVSKILIGTLALASVSSASAIDANAETSTTKTVTYKLSGISEDGQLIQNFTVPSDLSQILSISIDQGDVEYDLENNDKIEITASNGEYTSKTEYIDPQKYSMPVSTTEYALTSELGDLGKTLEFDDGEGHIGTLDAIDEPEVYSGEFVAGASIDMETSVTKDENNFDDNYYYDEDGYTGVLTKNGDASAEEVGYKTEKELTKDIKETGTFTWGETCENNNLIWKEEEETKPSDTKTYTDSEGYTGVLNYVKTDSYDSPLVGSPCSYLNKTTSQLESYNLMFIYNTSYAYTGTVSKNVEEDYTGIEYTQNYSGTVYENSDDARIWKRDYEGIAYKAGTSYKDYKYDYTVTVTYSTESSSASSNSCSYLKYSPLETTNSKSFTTKCMFMDNGNGERSSNLYKFRYDFDVTGISNSGK